MKGQSLLIIGIIIAGAIIGLAIAQGNVNITYKNLTTNFSTGYVNFSNITNYPGVILPAGNVTNATNFKLDNYTFPGNVTVLQKICLTSTCGKFIWSNGTHIIINNSA